MINGQQKQRLLLQGNHFLQWLIIANSSGNEN